MTGRIQYWRTAHEDETGDVAEAYLEFRRSCGLRGHYHDRAVRSLELTAGSWALLTLEHEEVLSREKCEECLRALGFSEQDAADARELWDDVHFA